MTNDRSSEFAKRESRQGPLGGQVQNHAVGSSRPRHPGPDASSVGLVGFTNKMYAMQTENLSERLP